MVPIGKKIIVALITLVFVVTFTFFVIRQMPGDPLYQWAAELVEASGMSFEEAYAQVKQMYTYDPDEPLSQQFTKYVKSLLRGDLGISMTFGISVNEIIIKALPWTVLVLSISLSLSFGLGVFLGMLIAWKRKTILEPIVTGYASFTAATPDYITALFLLVIFAIGLELFPFRGAYDISVSPGFNWEFLKSVLYHAALPIIAFTFEGTGGWAMAMRGSAVSVLGEDYIMAAKARGLKDRRIIVSYVGRNAILPMVTILAITFGGMLGGSVLIERVFNYPGIGWWFAYSLMRRDFGMIQGLFLVTSAAVIFANLAADILYSKLDPRIKLEG